MLPEPGLNPLICNRKGSVLSEEKKITLLKKKKKIKDFLFQGTQKEPNAPPLLHVVRKAQNKEESTKRVPLCQLGDTRRP